jgi:hypothetical protein
MAVFVFTPDSDTYDSLVLAKSRDYDRLNMFTGGALASDWRPISARILKGKKHGDFPSLAGHVPVFGKRALDALRPLVNHCIEVLPLKVPSGELFAINVLQITDCLDVSRSELELDPDGEVMYIARYAFDEQCLEGKHILKLRQVPLYGVFVSEEFKRRVEEEGLQGLIFREVG